MKTALDFIAHNGEVVYSSANRMATATEFCFAVKELANSKVKLVPFDVSQLTPPLDHIHR